MLYTHIKTAWRNIKNGGKVLGASTFGIVSLVSADFLKLIALAALVAMPLAYFLMHEWLKDFAYATTIPWWVFLASGIIGITIAMLTISYQSIKVASVNPANSIRQE